MKFHQADQMNSFMADKVQVSPPPISEQTSQAAQTKYNSQVLSSCQNIYGKKT